MSGGAKTGGRGQTDNTVLFSTTEGRARFPDFLQSALADKSIIGFDRYGRIVGAIVPIEAVRILAGLEEAVEPDVRDRVRRAALVLLHQAPSESRRLGLTNLGEEEPVELDALRSGHAARQPAVPRAKGDPA